MSELKYNISADTGDYTSPMEKAIAQTKDLAGALETVSSTPLEKLTSSTKETSKGVDDLVSKIEELKNRAKALGDESDNLGPKLDQIANIQRAQVVNEMAAAIGAVGNKVRETAGKFAQSDPELSKTLTNAANGLNATSAAAQGAAQGFAVAGPAGAAFGATIAGGLALATQAFDDMTSAQARAAESAKRAVDMARQLREAQREAKEEAAAAAKAQAEEEFDAATQRAKDYMAWRESEQKRIDAANAAREKKLADERVENQRRVNKASEEQAKATLSPEEFLRQKIANEQRALPPGAASNPTGDAEIEERKARILTMQKELQALEARSMQESIRAADAAQRQAEAKDRAAEAQRKASEAAAREEEILIARAQGDERRVKALERAAAIEALKLQLMREQGLSESNAQAAAERRQGLKEAAEKREENPRRTFTRNAEESAAAQQARVSDQARPFQRGGGILDITEAANKVTAGPIRKKDKQEDIAKKMDKIDQVIEAVREIGRA